MQLPFDHLKMMMYINLNMINFFKKIMLIFLYNAQFSTLIIAQAVLTYFIHAQKKQQPANNQ
jgi:preprotein translocase subunit SecF